MRRDNFPFPDGTGMCLVLTLDMSEGICQLEEPYPKKKKKKTKKKKKKNTRKKGDVKISDVLFYLFYFLF